MRALARLAFVLAIVFTGCASVYEPTGKAMYLSSDDGMGEAPPPDDGLKQRPPDEEPPERSAKRPRRRNDHPRGRIAIASGPGTFRYRTRGTANNANTSADAILTRLTYNARYFGVQITGIDSDSELRLFGSADTTDLFIYSNLPMWPNRRLRFVSRPGLYYSDVNLKNTVPADVEPRVFGFRYELEGEVDIIKRPRFNLSIYGAGRFEWGYGEARVNGFDENIDGHGWGWEAGVRVNLGRLFAGVAWIEREQEFEGNRRFLTANYEFEGAIAFIGFRW